MAAAAACARRRGRDRAHVASVLEGHMERAGRLERRIDGVFEIAARMAGRADLAWEPIFLVAAGTGLVGVALAGHDQAPAARVELVAGPAVDALFGLGRMLGVIEPIAPVERREQEKDVHQKRPPTARLPD